MIIELRFGINQKEGKRKNTERSRRYAWNFTILHIKTGEKDHQTPEKRDDQDGMCINLQKN